MYTQVIEYLAWKLVGVGRYGQAKEGDLVTLVKERVDVNSDEGDHDGCAYARGDVRGKQREQRS